MDFILKSTGTDGLVAKFEESAALALDPINPFTRIVEDMFRIEAAVFSSQGRRGGGSWKPLKPATAARKGSSRILEQTGALRDSLSQPAAEYQILEITKSGFNFGTDRPFAAVQQFGGGTGVPARPFLRFLPVDVGRWTKWLGDHITRPFHV